MEAAAGRRASLPMPSSQSARKEWRAVAEHPARSASGGGEELDAAKLGQSDERTIYEQGTGALEVDFRSVSIDGNVKNDLHNISRRREELQRIEIEIRAQGIARSEILEMRKGFDARIEEQANATSKLKEQLQEREQCIHELEMKMEEKERELRAIRVDHEAAWAKEDLLREQNKELVTYRREHENFEAERAQHLKQIHDLKEHIREKESQFTDLEEQHRVGQETIIYKDEQLREAQAWVAHVQEMDAFHSTTNHSLQAELRERIEQFNQFWLGCQRQFAEMERHHMRTIQQLQLELAEARERNGVCPEDSQMPHGISKDGAPYQNNGNQYNVNESDALNGNSAILPNGNLDRAPFVSADDVSTKNEHVHGVPVVPSSILGMGAFLPPGQVPALRPFVMHQQPLPQSVTPVNSHIPQAHVNHIQSMPSISTHQQWQNQQVVADCSQAHNQTPYQPSQSEQNILQTDGHYEYELSADGHAHLDYLKAHISSQQGVGSVVAASSTELQQAVVTNDKQYMVSHEPAQNFQENSPQFHNVPTAELSEQKSEPKIDVGNQVPKLAAIFRGQDSSTLPFEQGGDDKAIGAAQKLQQQDLLPDPWSSSNAALSNTSKKQASTGDAPECRANGGVLPEASHSAGQSTSVVTGKTAGDTLMDERSLLACIVRAIPSGAGGRIRISTTLPNRLGKMLAPLHWHDYKKQYGKLDDFVVCHPELFVIEGDFIHLREGAQEIISATTAVAKVAAAASAPFSSSLPSVAVTPVAQARVRRNSVIDAKPGNSSTTAEAAVVGNPADSQPSQFSAVSDKQSNGVCLNIGQGHTNIKILSKSNGTQGLNGFSPEMRRGHSPIHTTVANGANPCMVTYQNKGSSNGRSGTNSGVKQQGRAAGAGVATRR